MRNSRQVSSTIYHNLTRKSHSALDKNSSTYITFRINTPEPTKSSQESLTKNPPITLYRKNCAKVIQHGEVYEYLCDEPNCTGKLCLGLCGEPKGAPKVIGHVSHSEDYATNLVGDTDLEDQSKKQFLTRYDLPYTSEEVNSANPNSDEERTKKFLALLKKIEEDDGTKDI